MSTVRDAKGDPYETWYDLSWKDMNKAEQALWATLGWSEASWEEDEDPPKEAELFWKELNAAQKEAAEKLGYTEALWDEDDDDEDEDDEDEDDDE